MSSVQGPGRLTRSDVEWRAVLLALGVTGPGCLVPGCRGAVRGVGEGEKLMGSFCRERGWIFWWVDHTRELLKTFLGHRLCFELRGDVGKPTNKLKSLKMCSIQHFELFS